MSQHDVSRWEAGRAADRAAKQLALGEWLDPDAHPAQLTVHEVRMLVDLVLGVQRHLTDCLDALVNVLLSAREEG